MQREHGMAFSRCLIHWAVRAVVCFACLSAASTAGAETIEGVSFDPRATVNSEVLTLRGVALLRYMVFIKAYVGAFYLQQDTEIENVFGNVERRLVLHYFHGISAKDFAEATAEMIRKNVPSDRFLVLEPKIEQMNALYRDVEPGDRYAATYIPGKGTELALNGRPLGVVEGGEFSAAYFSIWIGKNPIDEGFRNKLLGK